MLALIVVLAVAACVNPISGARNTTIEQFPHQVALEFRGTLWCGGAIVGPKHILTAAHCIHAFSDYAPHRQPISHLKVRVGSTYRLKEGVLYDAELPVMFHEYRKNSPDWDVGILLLKEPIEFGPAAQKISIVPEGDERKHGELMTVAGWGWSGVIMPVSSTTGTQTDNIRQQYDLAMPEVLQMDRQPCIRRDMCYKVFTKVPRLRVTKNMFCAGGGIRRGSYRGYSGDALITRKKQVAGILAWRKRQTFSGYPSVYTNVAIPEINRFIRRTIANNR